MIRNAPPLVLLPAMGCDGQLWARQVVDLSDITHPMLGDLTVDDTLEAMATRVLAHAPPRFTVAGVSLGGYVALEIIRQAPDRVQRVALFGTRASMQTRPRTVAEQGLLATAPHADPTLTPIISGPVQAMAERVGAAVFERQQRAMLARPDISSAIAAVRVPTLVAVGEHDRICLPADARELSDHIPGSQFHEIRNCGHLAPLERPGQVTQLLRDWLQG
ncbi:MULTISPECIES: alpha/beta fold hydrolase [Sphingomonas]|jgi:pimeloyl-ACP methyl ester carboxylesterase|uniref:Alpha/beta fold hydrolase n=2 Tax=Pseudomonadota TaxID=1224 RepID=A0A7Y6B6C1_9SPHN|nr:MULTISPECIES: alpha/beta fold hydrolase [Sphingomonas]MBB4049724.1 pimeloyl-ACP methyl ester carboxylesterase [Sphingomonas zeae]MDK8185808.1 alpha/beta fold hydrolase [Sphingomonas zeae]MDK8215054.1 alpha/beta fold hydrolase [Sphingomonas sp. UMB7805-LC452B]NUU47835.1 alpha/beta fold hydrolase [Sphingomonas zeae]